MITTTDSGEQFPCVNASRRLFHSLIGLSRGPPEDKLMKEDNKLLLRYSSTGKPSTSYMHGNHLLLFIAPQLAIVEGNYLRAYYIICAYKF